MGWTNGVYDTVIDNLEGSIRIGGIIFVANVSSPLLHLFEVLGTAMMSEGVSEENFTVTINRITEFGIHGNSIGQPTPRISVSGTFPVRFHGNSPAKRSVHSTATRQTRDTGACASVDFNGDCIFDLLDVSCALVYISEGVLDHSTETGAAILNKITSSSSLLDVNRNNLTDLNDVIYLLKVSLGLLPFLSDVSILPVQSPNSQCKFGISINLRTASDAQATGAVVLADIGVASLENAAALLQGLNASGIVVAAEKTTNPFGAVLSLNEGTSGT